MLDTNQSSLSAFSKAGDWSNTACEPRGRGGSGSDDRMMG